MINTNGKGMLEAAEALVEGERNIIANLANISALIPMYFERINWAGFYLLEDSELVLGPFQGKPACVRIPIGKGVCGTAAMHMETVKVDDVLAFPGHIACDAASRSEIVVPLIKDSCLFGVLDVDSPDPARFSESDRALLEDLSRLIERLIIPNA